MIRDEISEYIHYMIRIRLNICNSLYVAYCKLFTTLLHTTPYFPLCTLSSLDTKFHVTFHIVSLRYGIPHYVTLRYVTLRYVTLRYVTLRYVTQYYVTLLQLLSPYPPPATDPAVQ